MMKNYAIPLLLLFSSCSTYHYITPTINTAMYSEAGETQAGLQFGTAGMAAHGGVALKKNINLNAYASFFPEALLWCFVRRIKYPLPVFDGYTGQSTGLV